ncbi:hypothetical protein WAI453_005117 [Rhynchosporium graminicola]|uniref:Uncharacterized protein n=1 Tax=Rhynchosporium graminicola TaxID=2792576 RepID=A0A1E1LAL2_9HELO|nr:uncharacterized protein RCO7_10247 [Rhynchosporium commune]
MTLVDELAILDEYFEQRVIGAGPADGTGESSVECKALEVAADFVHTRSEPLLQAVEKDAVTVNESTPGLNVISATKSESGLLKDPSEAGSLFTGPTSTTSFAAPINKNPLASDLQYSTLLKRSVLDESVQWLEADSVALKKVVDVISEAAGGLARQLYIRLVLLL